MKKLMALLLLLHAVHCMQAQNTETDSLKELATTGESPKKENLERIIHHGKGADSIVKDMVEHGSSSKGEKQPVDINALADEYLKLAYHAIQAKDKSFNVEMKTNFDATIEKINVGSKT